MDISKPGSWVPSRWAAGGPGSGRQKIQHPVGAQKTPKKPDGNKKPSEQPGKAASKKAAKKAAKEARRRIMREDVRSFVGQHRRDIEQRERDAEEQRRQRWPFPAFLEDIARRKAEVMAHQQEQLRLIRQRGPGRMGELGGSITRAFSIPADLDEDLEATREKLNLGRSEFYEIVFEYFLRVYED